MEHTNGVSVPEPPLVPTEEEAETDAVAALLATLQQQRQHLASQLDATNGALLRLQQQQAELIRQLDRCEGGIGVLEALRHQDV